MKAFRTAGLGWGGNTIRDYQHFDPTLLLSGAAAAPALRQQAERSGRPGNVAGSPDQPVARTAASASHSAALCRTAPSAAADHVGVRRRGPVSTPAASVRAAAAVSTVPPRS